MRETIVSREPWPSSGIGTYRSIEDGDWGYLMVTTEGEFIFDISQRPSDVEILNRWGFYFASSDPLGNNGEPHAAGIA